MLAYNTHSSGICDPSSSYDIIMQQIRLSSILLLILLNTGCGVATNANEEQRANSRPEVMTAPEKGFVMLFNGKDLTGWEGNTTLWSASDQRIVGNSPGIKHNDFLATTKNYSDFELRFDFRMTAKNGNSGVQFRSMREENSTAVIGYQADMGGKYWGCLYDEHRRRKVLQPADQKLAKVLKPAGWNSYRIRAQGARIQLWINDVKTVDYTEPDDTIARDGIIALQLHSGGPLKMEFMNLRLQDLSADE